MVWMLVMEMEQCNGKHSFRVYCCSQMLNFSGQFHHTVRSHKSNTRSKVFSSSRHWIHSRRNRSSGDKAPSHT